MKITKIRILFIAVVFLVPNFANAGCFARDDIKFEITKSPNVECLEIEVADRCTRHELEITNHCDTAFIYDNGNRQQVRIAEFYSDPDIPMDYINWTRELYSEKNPNEKVLISVKNVKVDPSFFSGDVIRAIFSIAFGVIALVFTLAGVANIIKTSFRKKRKKEKKNSK